MLKTYFVKASWTDPELEISRKHANGSIDIDLGVSGWWDVQQAFKDQNNMRYESLEEFTVDFIIEMSEGNQYAE